MQGDVFKADGTGPGGAAEIIVEKVVRPGDFLQGCDRNIGGLLEPNTLVAPFHSFPDGLFQLKALSIAPIQFDMNSRAFSAEFRTTSLGSSRAFRKGSTARESPISPNIPAAKARA